jgi:hypothetical protein
MILGAFFVGIMTASTFAMWVVYGGHLPSYVIGSLAQGSIVSLGMVVNPLIGPHVYAYRKRRAERKAG